jgi:hypothetical protein
MTSELAVKTAYVNKNSRKKINNNTYIFYLINKTEKWNYY